MRRSLVLAVLLAGSLAGAASAEAAPADAPFLLPDGACGQVSRAATGLGVPTADLLPPQPQSRMLPLCPGPRSCPPTCTASEACSWGPLSSPPSDCCTLAGGGLFCCDQDKDEIWVLECLCLGEGVECETSEVSLSCV